MRACWRRNWSPRQFNPIKKTIEEEFTPIHKLCGLSSWNCDSCAKSDTFICWTHDAGIVCWHVQCSHSLAHPIIFSNRAFRDSRGSEPDLHSNRSVPSILHSNHTKSDQFIVRTLAYLLWFNLDNNCNSNCSATSYIPRVDS